MKHFLDFANKIEFCPEKLKRMKLQMNKMNIQEPASLVQYIINLFLFIFRECIDGVGLDALKKAYQIIDDHPENKAEVRKILSQIYKYNFFKFLGF